SSVAVSAQDTVERLLRLHFRDGRTRVNADAQLLVAELLKVFVRGERAGPAPAPARDSRPWAPDPSPSSSPPRPLSLPLSLTGAAEAAARAARQAQAEDLKQVDTEQLEKVLPQLVCNR
ncbi:CENPX protein, partial [Pomatostomus ruficeps]|nr:CENPX protein [Pomatostomus ruficeps]